MRVLALAAVALIACGENPVEEISDSNPQLTLSADSVVVGLYKSSVPVAFTVRSGSGAIQYGVSLKYVSRDPSIASVNGSGAIEGVAVGSTYVVATLPDRADVRDSVRVRVHSDSCSGARPDFGGPATEADRQLFSYDVNAPLNLQKTPVFTNVGVEISNISFTSPDGGVVNGMMWDPATRPGLRPGIILMHGLPGNASSMAGQALTYAKLGAVVIAIDAPWNRRDGPELTNTYQDRVEQITVIKDLQRAVDVLRSRPNVDAARIAFMGASWGGATGALFVGIERRLKAAALVVGHGGQVSHATGPIGHKLISHLSCLERIAWIRAMAPIEPIRFVGHASPTALLLQSGRFDNLVPAADAQALHAAASAPKTILWYDAGHGLNQQAVFDRLDWLHAQLGLDARH